MKHINTVVSFGAWIVALICTYAAITNYDNGSVFTYTISALLYGFLAIVPKVE